VAILLCKVGQDPAAVTVEDNLQAFRSLVGGNLESHRLGGRVHLFCNEDGFGSLDDNRLSPLGLVCGDFFLSAGDAQGNTVSMSRGELHEWSAAVKGWPHA
jgi:hypothetical protein